MTPELWQRLKPLIHAALDCNVEERASFIRKACGDDTDLKVNLEQLLEAAGETTKPFDGPIVRPFSPEKTRFHSGDVILGRFRILRPIGRGGMGEVFEAEDLQLGRIALKTIRGGIASAPGAFDRFRQEVQLARRASGSQVCRIHELYLLPASDGIPATAFLTMEYLDGITLAEKLKKGGPLPLQDALRIAVDICEGLQLVHEAGVIHRDMKSANIMLCERDGGLLRAVLMDFGLARNLGSDVDGNEGRGHRVQMSTAAGALMGTPAYMAPEQFEAKPVSPATDIYALGIVLYELVTGLHPYAAPTPVAAAVRRAHSPDPPSTLNRSIPRKWDRVIQRCLQYDPADRFGSADEVARALLAGPSDLRNLHKDRPWLFRGAIAVVIALAAWGVSTWWQTRQYYHPDNEARRLYDDGLTSLREGNYVKATRLLQGATERDNRYVMAHARLAEAWYQLDFEGNAQKELLIALPERDHLPPLDAMYVDAIQAKLVGDTSSAIEDYKRILNRLAPADTSAGYVDLGMAFERSGDVTEALADYSRGAAEDGNNPAAFMHIGELQSRLHHAAEGEKAFDAAQQIFTREVNAEGLAELDFERGYAANARGDSKNAELFLKRSLDEASEIPSIQLEIRALAQLSSAESDAYHDSQAVDYAEQAIRLARDNRLESWAAIGLIRLASAQTVQGHFKEAEKPLQEALEILRASPQPRSEALANATLASLMNQEHQPDKVIESAKAALDYYRKNGFSEGASGTMVLLTRAERDKGQYKEALASGNDLIALASRTNLPILSMQAEELVGTIYLAIEDYPDALKHFEDARVLANTDARRAYEAFDCGEVLWRLGKYSESEAMLQIAAKAPALETSVGESRIESLLSQGKYGAALTLATRMLAQIRGTPADAQQDVKVDEAIAESHLGMKAQARSGLSGIVSSDQQDESPSDRAQHKLALAEIYWGLGMVQQAHDAALEAYKQSSSAELRDSELRSACLAAITARTLSDETSYRSFSKKVVDIVSDLQQNWGPELSHQYLSRPDVHALLQECSTGGSVAPVRRSL